MSVFYLSSCETTAVESNVPTESAISPAEVITPYPLSTCLVTGEPLGSKNDDRTLFHKGREVKVCRAACQMSFKMKRDEYIAKLP